MLQIRLNKGSAIDGGTGANPLPSETVTVACPDHLVLANLPVAKGLGSATSASTVKIVGRRSRRQLGERVHFCVRCDFPISLYGRLSPCEHAFCLDCARSDSICYLCDERIQKIQTIKMMEGIFICAAPHCLKSFLKKTEFESHIHNCHTDLLQPNQKKDEPNEPESSAPKPSSNLDSTARDPPTLGSGFPASLNSQQNDRDDKARRQQPKDQPPPKSSVQSKPPQYYSQPHHSDPHPDNMPVGLEGSAHSRMQHQNLDMQSGMQQDFGLPDPSHQDYPSVYPQQLPNFPMPVNSNPMLMGPPPFGFPPFPSDGAPPFFGGPAPFEVSRSDSTAEIGSDSGAALGFGPGPRPGGAVGFPEGFPQPWGGPPGNVPFDGIQGGQGVMQPPPPPPGPPPHHLLQHKHGYHSAGDW